MPIKHNRIKCNHCQDVIESTHCHDYVACKCGRVAADGGKDYLRRTFPSNVKDYEEMSEFTPGEFEVVPIRAEDFEKRKPFAKEDGFAKTFIAKCKTMNLFGKTFGLVNDQGLLRAAITVTENRKGVTNLQLLHTFSSERKNGLGKYLCEWALKRAHERGQLYFRVSAETSAVEFYKRIGYKFLGRQKSGCLLSIFKIGGPNIEDAIYDKEDTVIQTAMHTKARGGIVEEF